MLLSQALGDLIPVQRRHVQVKNEQIRTATKGLLNGLFSVTRLHDLEAAARKDASQQFPVTGRIVCDKDPISSRFLSQRIVPHNNRSDI